MILTTSTIKAQNQLCEIFPSPFASSSFKISFISSSDGSQTSKASVSLLRRLPSQCLSIFPDLSVSKVLKAFLSSLVAIASVVYRLFDLLILNNIFITRRNKSLEIVKSVFNKFNSKAINLKIFRVSIQFINNLCLVQPYLMGNCNQNFENIREDKDPLQNAELAASPYIGSEHQKLKPQPAQQHYDHVIDEQVIQATLVRNPDPVVIMPQKSSSQSPFLFPETSSIPEPSEFSLIQVHKKQRPKLQELDLSFYHSLALPDYEYHPLPQSERYLFENVQTYEMKDNYGVKYLGEWFDSKIHGNGVLMSNTSKYIGQFKNGLKHYHGRQIQKNQVYEGMFQGGRRKGQGTRYTLYSTQIGMFDDELVQGRILHLDGREQRKTNFVKIQSEQADSAAQIRLEQNKEQQIYAEKYYQQSQLPPEWQEQTNVLRKR